jgi:hypothetical protein
MTAHTPEALRLLAINNAVQSIASINAQLTRFRSGEDIAAAGEIEQLTIDRHRYARRLQELEA